MRSLKKMHEGVTYQICANCGSFAQADFDESWDVLSEDADENLLVLDARGDGGAC